MFNVKKFSWNIVNLSMASLKNVRYCSVNNSQEKGSNERSDKILLESIGLNKTVIENTLTNKKICQKLCNLIQAAGAYQFDKKAGNLVYNLSMKINDFTIDYQTRILNLILQNKITTTEQLDSVLNFIKQKKLDNQKIEDEMLEKTVFKSKTSCHEEISDRIRFILSQNSTLTPTKLLKITREQLPNVPSDSIYQTYQTMLKENPTLLNHKISPNQLLSSSIFKEKLSKFLARDLLTSQNTKEQLEAHLLQTNGLIVTRFPPEPNGYLHIGHAKAMRLSFMLAKEFGGKCYLRYDDTNPDTENKEFIRMIEENVKWLGYEPYKITHASDYFDKIYEVALKLIEKNKAYVCSQSPEEMHEYRKKKLPSPYRDRSINENLELFDKMKNVDLPKESFCLRLKIDFQHANPTMRDPVAYRIKHKSHPQTGNTWRIYPTYDFTHCLCDSFENITHSLCSLEFEIRRDLYYWILNESDLYKPFVWEYSRLNISNSIVSKRNLAKLIQNESVSGWDDPRLLTLAALKKRGVTPEAINEFIDSISFTRRGNENIISSIYLDNVIRKNMEKISIKDVIVLDPILLVLTKCNNEKENIYVEKADISLKECQGFYGIAPSKIFRLKNKDSYFETTKINLNETGEITSVEAKSVLTNEVPKGCLHWVSSNNSYTIEVREFNHLFKNESPDTDNLLSEINSSSIKIYKNAKSNTKDFKMECRYHFERNGYYILDSSSDLATNFLIFNRVVGLVDKERVKILEKLDSLQN